nr:uncharacterized protein LOC129447207 [Misgurnus anguillicaudatus]
MLDSPQSFQEESLVGSDIDYEPVPGSSQPRCSRGGAPRARGRRGRGRGASTSRERGECGRGRGSGRARGRGRLLVDLSREDFLRVEELHKQRMAIEEDMIKRLTLDDCQQLLQRWLTREPSLIFDLMSLTPDPPPPGPPHPQAPSWCVCRNCRNMPTLLEQKCCQQQPQNCTSLLPHMELYILQEGVLRLARRIWNDLRAEVDIQQMGPGHRIVIASSGLSREKFSAEIISVEPRTRSH